MISHEMGVCKKFFTAFSGKIKFRTNTFFRYFVNKNNEKWCFFRIIIGGISRHGQRPGFLHNLIKYSLAVCATEDLYELARSKTQPVCSKDLFSHKVEGSLEIQEQKKSRITIPKLKAARSIPPCTPIKSSCIGGTVHHFFHRIHPNTHYRTLAATRTQGVAHHLV